jgi:hypothetical protein
MKPLLLAAVLMFAAALGWAAPADASPNGPDYPCQYPGVGISANAVGGYGGFCDFPTEINGAHWHCETGGFDAGGIGLAPIGSGVNIGGLSVIGGGGTSCSWRWPDNTPAPAPNPPGAWKNYMIPMAPPPEHAAPAGPQSELVHPDQGIPSGSVATPPPSGNTPAVTNPDVGNPDATTNPRK